MTEGNGNSRKAPSSESTRREQISHLKDAKSFQDEMVKLIRIYTSNPSFSSERCLQEIVSFIARRFNITFKSAPITYELDGKQYVAQLAGGLQMGGKSWWLQTASDGGMLFVFSR